MKYKIIVDKQPKTNASADKKEYEIDIEELRYKDDVKDTLVITKDEDYVMRRLSLSEYHVLSVLDEPKKEPLDGINIQLFEGDNYIYIADETGSRFYAEYLITNEFNGMYALRSEVNSKIEQLADSVEIGVNKKLEGYATTKEMNAAIKVESDKINQSVIEIETDVGNQSKEIGQLNTDFNSLSGEITSVNTDLKKITTKYSDMEQTVNGWNYKVESIEEQLENGTVKSNNVQTTIVSITDAGVSVGKSDSQIKSLLDNEGLYVNNREVDKENPDNNLLKADINGVTTENLLVRTYATLGYHRFEKYKKNGKQRTGLFWVGGA